MNDDGSQGLAPWLTALASAAPSPGGGAAAALSAAAAAGLISMVCNLTIGKPKYAEHEALMKRVLARAESLRGEALSLADDDAKAFDAVIDAYKLPRSTPEEQGARAAQIEATTVAAAQVPLRAAALAAEIVGMAEQILPGANVNVLSDVAVAAINARAALEASVVNVEVNLAGLKDAAKKATLAAELERFRAPVRSAEAVVKAVRERIAR
jgi:formiminotetrahydrofolate cyclodeaminase